ncbi:MAG: flagellar protein FlgN [bacterium]
MNAPVIQRNYPSFSMPRRVERKPEPVRERPEGEYSDLQHQRKPSVKTLIAILKEEIILHEDLLNLKQKERPCLASGAVGELEKVTSELNVLVEKIRKLEDQRREEMVRWAEFVGCKPSHITLRMIAQRLSPEEGETLIGIGERLKALVIAVRDENNMNQLLLRRSLRLLNEEVKLFTNSEESNISYTSTGAVTHKQPPSRSRLVDCRA